jgi:hypothetical protein
MRISCCWLLLLLLLHHHHPITITSSIISISNI